MQPQLNGKASTMTMMPPSPNEAPEASGILPSQTARIEVIGVGGGGSNAVNRMIQSDLEGVGKASLVDHLHAPAVVGEPDGAGGAAVDLHDVRTRRTGPTAPTRLRRSTGRGP